MHILTDITHPAHAHFFKNAIGIWKERGHQVTITARGKEITTRLLKNLGFDYIDFGQASSGMVGLGKELLSRDVKLSKFVRQQKPDVLTAIGGIFIAHAGFLTRTPSVVFYDTEHAHVQNALTYPLASAVCTPTCYEGRVFTRRHIAYDGYHELAYMHPGYFTPDPDVLTSFGLNPKDDFIILRLVAWGATHDIGDKGITDALQAVKRLERFGKVLISSERPLKGALENYRFTAKPELMHHLLYYAKLFIGESATMASESAVVGTPAVFISTSTRGYTNEQGRKYKMVYTYSDPDTCQQQGLKKAFEILSEPKQVYIERSRVMRNEMIDVTQFMVKTVEHFGKEKKI